MLEPLVLHVNVYQIMATIQANQDAAEDVNDFLQRIRDQNADRDREDGERTRRLEEEIWQARRERQARRAGTYCRKPLSSRY